MRVSHARGPGKPRRAVQHRLEDPAPHPPCLLRRSSGPFTEVFNLPFGSGICSRFASKAHLPASAPLRARAPGSLSGQLCEHLPGGDPALRRSLFLLPFSRRHPLPGHPVPPGASAPLTIGLPPRLRIPVPARRTLARFTRSARMRPRPAGLSFTPGTAVFTGRRGIRGRRLPPRSGGPCHPGGNNPARDVIMRRHQQEFPGSGPTGPSPHLWPPWLGRRPLGFSVSFAPSRSGTGHARHGGDRPSTTCSYVPGISQTSSTSSLTTCDLVSQCRFIPALSPIRLTGRSGASGVCQQLPFAGSRFPQPTVGSCSPSARHRPRGQPRREGDNKVVNDDLPQARSRISRRTGHLVTESGAVALIGHSGQVPFASLAV